MKRRIHNVVNALVDDEVKWLNAYDFRVGYWNPISETKVKAICTHINRKFDLTMLIDEQEIEDCDNDDNGRPYTSVKYYYKLIKQ